MTTPPEDPYGPPNANPYGPPNANPYGPPNANPYGPPTANPYGLPPVAGGGGWVHPAPYDAGFAPPGSRLPAPRTAGAATGHAFRVFGANVGTLVLATLIAGIAGLLTGAISSAIVSLLGLASSDANGTTSAPGPASFTVGGQLLNAALAGTAGVVITFAFVAGLLRLLRTGQARLADFLTVPTPRGIALQAAVGVLVAPLSVLAVADDTEPLVALLALGVGLGSIVAGVLLAFYQAAAVDDPPRPVAAALTSVRLAASAVGWVILTQLIMVGLIVAGALACVVGLLAAYPIAFLALLTLYLGRRGESVPVPVRSR